MSASKSGGASLTFTYDSEGLRLTKKVGSTTYSYTYAGGKLLRQTWGSNTIDFFYDVNGNPYALKYNGTLYYYITNLQGDVLKIVNTSGTPVVSYSYDPYGKPIATSDTSGVSLGTVNPLRYRGYVYDSESGLYYLQSRYYDPTTCRFINADSYASTGQGILGCNMFAYCNNNPIIYKDSDGLVPNALFDVFPAIYGEGGILKESNPKDSPPDHPDFKEPKKGNKKGKNPNGPGYGWVDSEGNVWVWDPKMHGGPGWIIQEPDGGHSHAYPGGGTRKHTVGTPAKGMLLDFPSSPKNQNANYIPQSVPAMGGVLIMVFLFDVSVSMLNLGK